MSVGLPAWVLHSTLGRPRPTQDGAGLLLGGVLVLGAEAPADLAFQLVVDGTPVPTRWQLPSPKLAAKFPHAANASRARFRSESLPILGGRRVELVLENPRSGARIVAATRKLPSGPPRPVPDDLAGVRSRIDSVVAGQERNEAEYDALRAGLDRAGEAERDPARLETAVLLDGAFRMRPRATFRRLGELRRLRREQGQAAAFDEFHARFTRLLAPYTLNSHGYQTALESLEPREVWEGVEAITIRIAELGHECFVNSGTLLGIIRDGRLIGHDDDVDVAVLMHASELPEVASEWVGLRARLGRLLDEEFEAARHIHCKIRLDGGAKVDLFPAWLSDDEVFIWPHTWGGVPRGDLLPLERFSIHGADVAVPRRPESLLDTNYGPDWPTADPTWRFAWPAAKELFSDFAVAMAAGWDAREIP